MQSIKVLAIVDEQNDIDMIKSKLNECSQQSNIIFEQTSVFAKGEDLLNYDIILVKDNSFKLNLVLDVTQFYRSKNQDNHIFVISDLDNPKVLDELLNMEVNGYVNSQDWDFGAIIRAIQDIEDFRNQSEQLEKKLNILDLRMR